MADKKFSQFAVGNELQVGDLVVGLRSGVNEQFSFPSTGIKDASANYLFGYASAGALSVNYLQFVNSLTGNSVKINTIGTDTNIDIEITPKGLGYVTLDGVNWPNADGTIGQILTTDGAGQTAWTTGAGVVLPTTDMAIARFDGVDGILQNSVVILSDAGAISGVTRLDVDNVRIDGNTISSTDTDGDLNLVPNGAGDLILDLLAWPQADGTTGQALTTNGAGQIGFSTVPTVTVPTVDMTVARFDGVAGAIEDSGVTISDSDVMSGITQLNVDNLRLDGNAITSTNANGDITITPNGSGVVVMDNIVIDGAAVQHNGDLNNQILFGTDTQSFETGGASRIDISDTGMRLGAANARVTTILTDGTMASAADTNLYTGLAIKTYVDAVARGLNVQGACVCASTTALTATYANGSSGVGATLTNAGALAAISLDGVSPTVGQRVLIKNQASTFQNGIYTVTTVGSGAVNWVLTRATDYDTAAEIQPGDFVIITGGTVQSNSSWIQTATVVTVGTDPITWIQFSASIPVSLANGGTSASLTASNGGIFYSTASAGAILAGTATANQILMSGASSAPAWSTATYPATATGTGKILRANGTNWLASTATFPDTATATGTILRADGTNWVATTTTWPATTTINRLLWSSAANVISDLATANSGTLITSSGGVPSISSTLPSAVQTNITSLGTVTNTPQFSNGLTFGSGAGTLNYYAGSTSWTPTMTFATPGDLSVSYATQSGNYCRIGDLVIVNFALACTPTYTTASGVWQITNAPQTAGTPIMHGSVIIESAMTFAAGRTYPVLRIGASSTTLTIVSGGSAVTINSFTTTQFPTTVQQIIRGTITYFV